MDYRMTRRGLLIYTDITMDASLVDIPSAFCNSIFVSVKIVDQWSRILIGNIYRSPNSTQVNDEHLYQLLDYVDPNFKIPKLIVGDFNYRNINWYSVCLLYTSPSPRD